MQASAMRAVNPEPLQGPLDGTHTTGYQGNMSSGSLGKRGSCTCVSAAPKLAEWTSAKVICLAACHSINVTMMSLLIGLLARGGNNCCTHKPGHDTCTISDKHGFVLHEICNSRTPQVHTSQIGQGPGDSISIVLPACVHAERHQGA